VLAPAAHAQASCDDIAKILSAAEVDLEEITGYAIDPPSGQALASQRQGLCRMTSEHAEPGEQALSQGARHHAARMTETTPRAAEPGQTVSEGAFHAHPPAQKGRHWRYSRRMTRAPRPHVRESYGMPRSVKPLAKESAWPKLA